MTTTSIEFVEKIPYLTKSGKVLYKTTPDDWRGVMVSNQQEADERIPLLLKTPASVRFLSCDPLIGPVDLLAIPHPWRAKEADWVKLDVLSKHGIGDTGIHWVIVGCESGRTRRQMKNEWAESIAEQCRAAGVSFFMKQMEVDGKVTGDIGDFPINLQVREFPGLVAQEQ